MKPHFGFIVIDKPQGITSHDCVNRLRKVFKTKRVGHGGTLDPSVTGVLPIAIGQATRLLPYMETSKKYLGTVQLGQETNTDDLEGEVISNKPWPELDQVSIQKHLNHFRGLILQRPPIFSSVHLNGERAYKKARKGDMFELPSKNRIIHKLDSVSYTHLRAHET